jgi:hypothetical protein
MLVFLILKYVLDYVAESINFYDRREEECVYMMKPTIPQTGDIQEANPAGMGIK